MKECSDLFSTAVGLNSTTNHGHGSCEWVSRQTDSSPPDISPTDNSPTDIPSKSPRRTFRQPYIFSSKIRSYFLINPMITTVQNYYKIQKNPTF